MTDTAARFCDRYIRQNTAELPHIKLEEHVKLVRHSAAEMAIYLGQAHDAPDLDSADAFSDDNKKALENLLKLCTHFQAAGGRSASQSAEEECYRIRERKDK